MLRVHTMGNDLFYLIVGEVVTTEQESIDMVITLGDLIIWLIIAALVGFVGELLARRRTPFGIVGAIIVGFIAIFLVVVLIWSAFAYRHAYGYYTRYNRRGGYIGRPRRRYRRF